MLVQVVMFSGQAASDKSSCPGRCRLPGCWVVGGPRHSLACHVFVTDIVGMWGGVGGVAGQEVNLTSVS